MSEVNEFIDLGLSHDEWRSIRYGHWDPEELYRGASEVYGRWGYEGVKAFIHHHVMDYTCSLLAKLKYGALIRSIVDQLRRYGFARVYEDVDSGQLYLSPTVRGALRIIDLRGDEVVGFIASRLIPMVDRVLELMIKDFSKPEDEVSRAERDAANGLRDCIRSLAAKLIEMYVDSLIEGKENPCRSKGSKRPCKVK